MDYDSQWYSAFLTVFRSSDEFGTSDSLLKTKISRKRLFLENEVENPLFTYKANINIESVRERYQKLVDELAASDANEVVKQLYFAKIAQQLTRIEFTQAAIKKNDVEAFKKSVELYGKPKKKYFRYVARRVQKIIAERSFVDKDAARRLDKIFAKIDTEQCVIDVSVLPEPVVDEGKVLNSTEVKAFFENYLQELNIEGWKVEIDRTRARLNFAVSGRRKTIHVPNSANLKVRKRPLTHTHAEAIAEHEIGVHIQRSFNGSQQPLKLMEIGLAHYLRGEEGLATYAQQQTEGATEFAGFDNYLALSLAVGLDGEPRDFRSVYVLMVDYYILIYDGKSGVEAYAQKMAWRICTRVFRGTTARTPGCVFTRDIVYLEGNIGVWNLLTEHPVRFADMFVGKYDPLSKGHLTSLQKLGILPQY